MISSLYVRLLLIMLLFYGAFGITLLALPLYVVEDRGLGEASVGLVFASYAVAAVLARPVVGSWGDRRGRRSLVVLGSLVATVALISHVRADTLVLLVLARLVVGVGQAAVLVGITTLAIDHAADDRRGQASSYIMLAIQLGLGLGPLLGGWILQVAGYNTVWLTAATLAAAAGCLGLTLPRERRSRAPAAPLEQLIHPAGLRPGILVAAGMMGFSGYLAFVPLYAVQVGSTTPALLFLLASGVVVLLRVLGGRLPDRLGPRRGAAGSLGLITSASLMMSAWATPAGLALSTVVLAAGVAFLAPALAIAATAKGGPADRARVMATFTLFIDASAALGPLLLGAAVAASGFRAAFLLAAALSAVGCWLSTRWLVESTKDEPLG